YASAPAIWVTPRGAISIVIDVCFCDCFAHVILREKLHMVGILGCILCYRLNNHCSACTLRAPN
ncbi:putative magnesium transporter NIPA4, partial [Bienertia sinuspersici]